MVVTKRAHDFNYNNYWFITYTFGNYIWNNTSFLAIFRWYRVQFWPSMLWVCLGVDLRLWKTSQKKGFRPIHVTKKGICLRKDSCKTIDVSWVVWQMAMSYWNHRSSREPRYYIRITFDIAFQHSLLLFNDPTREISCARSVERSFLTQLHFVSMKTRSFSLVHDDESRSLDYRPHFDELAQNAFLNDHLSPNDLSQASTYWIIKPKWRAIQIMQSL